MSIPDWSYDESYYAALTKGTGLEIRTDPVKGKGLFATKAFKTGESALAETALCCTQNVDEVLRQVPVCMHCLVSLETPQRIVSRVTSDKTLANALPHVDLFPRKSKIYCRNRPEGCTAMFCSSRCADEAWRQYHFVGCVGNMTEDGKAAYIEFVQENWEQGGVDYSDTHFFAFRFLCIALSRHRLQGLPLNVAYAPVAQLIRAPLKKFNFTFLLGDEESVEAKYNSFIKFKANPEEHPAVVEASKELKKDTMLEKGHKMLQRILSWNASEQEFFTIVRWSELLGAVLLNGQERTPNSPFTEYNEFLQKFPDGESQWKALKKKLGGSSVVNKCHSSSKGQGIYTIGACFNHSCEPNLQILYSEENDETLVAVCIRDIAPGDECTISYINEEMRYIERHQQLFEHYLFDCLCAKCVKDRETTVVPVAVPPSSATGAPSPPQPSQESSTSVDTPDA